MLRRSVAFSLLLLACERTAPTSSSTPAASSAAPAVSAVTPAPSAAALGPKDVKFLEDLNTFCVATQQVKADASIPEDQRAKEIIGRLIASRPDREFLVLLRSLSGEASGEHRYLALKRAAAERGATNWACPALMD